MRRGSRGVGLKYTEVLFWWQAPQGDGSSSVGALYSRGFYREVSEYLVGSAAFKAVETGDPRLAGSIPVHLRKSCRAVAGLAPTL